MSISEKLVTIAENQEKVYKSGQSSMIDESKIIKKTVSGKYISSDDVSEIPHDIKVTLTSGGKNLWANGDSNFTTTSTDWKVNLSAGKTYTFSVFATSSDTDKTGCLVYDVTNGTYIGYVGRDRRSSITFTPSSDIKIIRFYASEGYSMSVDDTAKFKDIMIEEGDTATAYEPYKEILTDYSGVSFNTYGKNLFNQAGMKTGTQSGVTLEYLEEEDCFLLNGTSTLNENKFLTYIKVKGQYGEVNTLSMTYISGDITIPSGNAVFYIGRYGYTDSGNGNWSCVNLTTLNTSKTMALTGTMMDRAWIYLTSGISFVNYKFRIQLEHGSQPTPYEKFQGQTLTANSDGTVKGIKSTSPYMYMTTDNENVTINAEYHKSYGIQTEYDRFWDSYQNYGKRIDYSYAFSGQGWNDNTYNPKYPIVKPSQYSSMFRGASITNINQEIDFTAKNNVALVFDDCLKLVKIKKIIVSENTTYDTWFDMCNELKEIYFDGIIGNSISFHSSKKLLKSVIIHIFEHLSSTVTGKTLTLSQTAVTNEFGGTDTSEWLNLVASKANWTISLV